jgi:hypothetical protein
MPFLAAIPAWIPAVVGAVGAVVGAATSLIGAQQQSAALQAQAAAQRQQAEQAQQIANYNADIQRQNAEVAYKLSVAQAQANASTAEFNKQGALINQRQVMLSQQTAEQNRQAQLLNQRYALEQAAGARKAYEQGLSNAETQKRYADTIRAQGEEQARRKRDENDRKIATIRAKYGGSGVTFEGSPLVVLSDAATLAETTVQDIAYVTELERQKQLRVAEIEEFNAGFSLLDEQGYKVQALNYAAAAETAGREKASLGLEAANYRNQGIQQQFAIDLTSYDTAIAGAKQDIANREAKLTELAGGAQAYGFQAQAAATEAQASASLISGYGQAAGALVGGFQSAYQNTRGFNFTPTPRVAAGAYG